MTSTERRRLGVLTSGGDSQGMNAAVRAVVRTALSRDAEVYAIFEGYQGMVDGGDRIRRMASSDVGGIIQQGGTIIGSARCAAFRTRAGRRQAARNLVERGIDALVIIGGDGSLTGADVFRREWRDLLAELVAEGAITQHTADAHPRLHIVGLVGSIDNDMFGTDMTIGADTALHRIVEALDAIASTAASHQRTFVVEVMGRHCGYLALMSALATGAQWVLIPECPPESEDWEGEMCRVVDEGRQVGRRHSIVVVAEGAQDRRGRPISAQHVRSALEERLGEDTRVTILGHVQRGGTPSAFDRNMSSLLGHGAVEELLSMGADDESKLLGIRQNQLAASPLMECVAKTHQVADLIAAQDYERAVSMRGGSFAEAVETFRTMIRVRPRPRAQGEQPLRLGLIHSGGLAPGMNAAIRVAVRQGIDKGHRMLAIRNGFAGFIDGEIDVLDWMSVSGWVSRGGAELGTSRYVPSDGDLEAIASQIRTHGIDGLLMVGGWSGYRAAHKLYCARARIPALDIPIICMPASIDNDLPGSQLSIGADTALNNIVSAVDKIKQCAVASRRCFVVEVMGGYCGYLALMSGLATGSEQVYLHEQGISLELLQADLAHLVRRFEKGKRLGMMIRNERADPFYTTDFICSLFEKEGGDLFDVRRAVLGHIQQGGDPSPFDRVQASRLAVRCIEYLSAQAADSERGAAMIGLQRGRVTFTPLDDWPQLADEAHARPRKQWWLDVLPIAELLG